MKKLSLYTLYIISLSLFLSCSKEGPGGKASIHGKVMHHSLPIPGAAVYIRYGAKESPGSDITQYDTQVTADANAAYRFSDLKKGDYYLFAVGFDSSIAEIVKGGIPVEIKSKTENVEADIPVVE